MFEIEQIAIKVPNIDIHIAHLAAEGHTEWVLDQVSASGYVFGKEAHNVARLAYNYNAIPGKELELIQYIDGRNWLQSRPGYVGMSHMGLHVDRISEWYDRYPIAQEVITNHHTNPNLPEGRRYWYVVFDTFYTLGFDLKIIQRLNTEDGFQHLLSDR